MKYYYTYKVTLTKGSLKDHYYYGKHETINIDDGYKGSGKIIGDYYKKHPNDYIIDIIQYYKCRHDLCVAEEQLINEHIDEPLCLNILKGSFGGDNYTYLSDEEKLSRSDKISASLKKFYIEHPEKRDEMSKRTKGVPQGPMTEEHYKNFREAMKLRRGKDTWMKGKKHKDESLKLISEHNWTKNPEYEYLKKDVYEKVRQTRTGTRRMRKDGISIYVKQDEIQHYLDNGWEFGGTSYKRKENCPKYKWMKKDNKCVQVSENNWNKYLKNGWKFGRLNIGGGNKGMKKICKNGEYKNIRPNEFEQYLNDGWKFCNP